MLTMPLGGKLTESLKKIAEDQNPKGLNLTIEISDLCMYLPFFADNVNQDLPDDKRSLIPIDSGSISTRYRFETPKEACQRRLAVMTDKYGALEVSDEIKTYIAEGRIKGSDLIQKIRAYNSAFPKNKISYVVTEDLETEAFSKDDNNKTTDCIVFSAKEIKSTPDVTFRLKDTKRADELKKAGLKVELRNAGEPDAYLTVSAAKRRNSVDFPKKPKYREETLTKRKNSSEREKILST